MLSVNLYPLVLFPSYVKMTHITPIIKQPKLDKTPLQNYRPISNLSTLFKTLERVVAKQLKAYLHKYNI